MNTKLATSRMRTGQWADIIKDCNLNKMRHNIDCAAFCLKKEIYMNSRCRGGRG